MDTLKKLGIFLLLSFLILSGVADASGQDSINELIKNGGEVKLSGTYTLTGPIMLSSDLKLNGQNSTIITIPDDADWPVWVPLMKGEGLHDVTIEGIEFNANSDGNDDTPHGRGYYNCIHLIHSRNITVRNCLFHDGKGDGLRTKYCGNVKFYNNTAYKLGHDCFYAIDSEGILAWNNTLTTRTNSGLRLWNSKDAYLFCNKINAQLDSLGGNPGIQIEDSKGTMDNVNVFANNIYETWGPGIWLISYDEGSDNIQNVTVDHNLILKDGVSYNIDYTAGITINGAQGTNISNNVFDGCKNAGILVLNGGQNTKIEKNIITNTREHSAISQSGTGWGIDNRQRAEISVLNNCFFNNVNGNVFGAESVGNDLQDPTIHNTSSGWMWDGAGWLCNYVINMENYTIGNWTYIGEIFENETNNIDVNDTDLHEVKCVRVNNSNPLNNTSNYRNVQVELKIVNSSSENDFKYDSDNGTLVSLDGNSSTAGTGNNSIDSGESGSGNPGEISTPDQDKIITSTPTLILPVPGFTTDPVNGSGSIPLVVNFHSIAQNAVDTKWDFGDTIGNEATGADVSHTYSAVGTYTVTQTVTNPNGTFTASAQIKANNVLTPAVADFIATPMSGSAPLRINFTDKSQFTNMPGSTVAYNFGGFEGTSSERNTSHIYNMPGTYYVTQIVTNPDSPPGGSTKQVVITVNEAPAVLAANFNANCTNGIAPLSVTFTDESTGATTYMWDFGDGDTSTDKNLSHIYTAEGDYTVTLTVTGKSGDKSTSQTIIKVSKPQFSNEVTNDLNSSATPLNSS